MLRRPVRLSSVMASLSVSSLKVRQHLSVCWSLGSTVTFSTLVSIAAVRMPASEHSRSKSVLRTGEPSISVLTK